MTSERRSTLALVTLLFLDGDDFQTSPPLDPDVHRGTWSSPDTVENVTFHTVSMSLLCPLRRRMQGDIHRDQILIECRPCIFNQTEHWV